MIRKWFRRKPLNVLEGGTGANTFEKACENLGAVKKTGDIITGNLEFYGESGDNSFIHPVVNAKAGDNGIDVVVGGSNNESSLVVGCGDWANGDQAPSGAGDLNLTAHNSIRLFQKRVRNLFNADGTIQKDENGENKTENYLAERWRFSTNGYLQHINAYDQQNYHPFQCMRTYVDNNKNPQEASAGSLRLNSSIGQQGNYIQGDGNTLFGIQSNDAKNNNSNYLFLGAKGETVKENGVDKLVTRKIVSFRPGLDSTGNASIGKDTAEAWRAALIDDKGYGISGNDSNTAKAWRSWILPWTSLGSVATATSSTLATEKVGTYTIPAKAQEILIYGRSSSKPYRYGSTLILPKLIFESIASYKEGGRIFMLGGGWNSGFGGDAAKIKLAYDKDKRILDLYVQGVSVGGSWVGNSWIFYYR